MRTPDGGVRMSKGTTNAIYVPRQVRIDLTGKFYKASSKNWHWCMDADQIATYQAFMSDMDRQIRCFAWLNVNPIPQYTSALWQYELRVGDTNFVITPSASPSLTTSLRFSRIGTSATNSPASYAIRWNDTSSTAPTNAANTYSINTQSDASDAPSITSGMVGYLAMVKIV